jgi:tRNA-specific 2-thiouridylase
VAAKDAARNALLVVQGHDHPQLFSTGLESGRWHWLAPLRGAAFEAGVKLRYRQTDQPAHLQPRVDGTLRVLFAHPQRAVTPGQYVVAYEAERCLGGAVIESVTRAALHSAAA